MKQFIDFCKERVVEDVQSKIDTIMDINDVYVVWSCKLYRIRNVYYLQII